ncbi:MAG: LTA synthase family protein, partial [Caulobacteraceae bacterium]
MNANNTIKKITTLLKNNINIEIAVFSMLVIAKLLLFNQMVESSSIKNIALIASVAGTVLMLLCWTSLIPRPLRIAVLYLVDCGATFIIISDLLFYRYFNDIISMPVLTQASNVSSVKSSVTSLVHGFDVVFVLDIIVLPFVMFFRRKVRRIIYSKYTARVLRFVAVFAAGAALFAFGMTSLLKSQPNILKSFYDRVYIVENIGLLSFHSIDAYNFIATKDKGKMPLTEDEKNEVKDLLLQKKSQQPANPKYFGAGKGKNLIVIQVEALQGFVINSKINGQEITPNLNKFIKDSVYFDNYYTETAGGGTSDAEFLANNSLFPAKDGSVYIRFPGNEYYSLPKRLKEEGYSSTVMHAYKAGFWNRSVMYKSLGFDQYISKNDYEQDEIIGMGLSDKSFF